MQSRRKIRIYNGIALSSDNAYRVFNSKVWCIWANAPDTELYIFSLFQYRKVAILLNPKLLYMHIESHQIHDHKAYDYMWSMGFSGKSLPDIAAVEML